MLKKLLKAGSLFVGSSILFVSSSSNKVMASSEETLIDPSVKDPKKAPNIYVFRAKDIDGNMVGRKT